MRAGRLNKRITIQSPATGQDATGEPTTGWTDVATVWASIVDVSGREYVAAGGLQNSAQTMVTLRFRAGIVPSMRVVHGADTFNVEAVLGQDGLGLLLMCSRLS